MRASSGPACGSCSRAPVPALPAAEALDSSWFQVVVVRAFEDARAGLHAGGRHEHGEALERCQRLYAVATALLARHREELAAERAACSAVCTHLRRARPEGASGGSCNVRA